MRTENELEKIAQEYSNLNMVPGEGVAKKRKTSMETRMPEDHNDMVRQFCESWDQYDKTRSIMATSFHAYSTAVKARRDMIHRGEGGCQKTKIGDFHSEKR